MDLQSFGLGVASGLLVGLIVGWFGHRLTLARSAHDRKILDETERLDRCAELFAARVRYVVAYHSGGGRYYAPKQERKELDRRYPTALPEVVLAGVPEWDAYVATEKAMLEEAGKVRRTPMGGSTDTGLPRPERVKRIEQASVEVQRVIAERRVKARR